MSSLDRSIGVSFVILVDILYLAFLIDILISFFVFRQRMSMCRNRTATAMRTVAVIVVHCRHIGATAFAIVIFDIERQRTIQFGGFSFECC